MVVLSEIMVTSSMSDVRILLFCRFFVFSAERVAILSGVSTFPLDVIQVLLHMSHSSGKNRATSDLIDTETLFNYLFGDTTSVLTNFFSGIFYLKYYCHLLSLYLPK